MRYGFLTFEFPPAHGGGLSTYMVQTLKMLREAGHQAFVVVTDNGIAGQKFETFEGHTVLRVNVVNDPVGQTLGYWAAASYVVAEALKTAIAYCGMPDVLEVCDGFGLGYYTLQRKLTLEAPFRDLKICVTAHTPCALIRRWEGANWHRLPDYWTREAEIFCFKAADIVLAPSQFIIDQLRADFECADVRFTLVRNPYRLPPPVVAKPKLPAMALGTAKPDRRARAAAVAAPAVPDTGYYMLASRLAVWKGVLDIAQAFDLYWQGGGKARLKLFGADTETAFTNGSVAAFLKTRYAKHVAAGRLEIPALVKPEILAQQRRGAIALVHPSHKENLPYTIIEHMAGGGIALASAQGGQAEFIEDQVNGFLFQAQNPASLLEALIRCDALAEDKRLAMSQAASATITRMSDYEVVQLAKDAALAQEGTRPADRFPFIRGEERGFAPLADIASPRLSVVVPYFNLPELVEETVMSALNSTFTDLEVIVVNDGSTDADSPAVLAKLARLPRVRVITQTNGGVAVARNTGVAAAKAGLIALLDADDIIHPTYYERCIAVLDQYANVGFVGCWNDDFNEHGTMRHWPTFNPEPPMQLIFNTTNCQGLVVRRQAYLDAGGHDPALKMFLDDWEATIAMLAQGTRGVMIPHPLFRYRNRATSIFRSKADLWMQNYEYITRKHQGFYGSYMVEIIAFLNANGSNRNYHNPTFPAHLGEGDRYMQGRLFRLLRGYYIFTEQYRAGRVLRRILSVFSPLLNILLASLYRLRRGLKRA
jgi:glycosyltransferase involved in cell wall biosynthesis